jgi:hypothetical protein
MKVHHVQKKSDGGKPHSSGTSVICHYNLVAAIITTQIVITIMAMIFPIKNTIINVTINMRIALTIIMTIRNITTHDTGEDVTIIKPVKR